MDKKFLKNMEWWLVIWSVALCILGLIALFSATTGTEHSEFNKQIMWIAVSIIIMLVVTFIDYDFLVRISPILYILSIILLVAVLFTRPINGARSWFMLGSFNFQPSELAKIFVIMFIAFLISRFQETGRNQINKFWKLVIILVAALIPIGLIIIQPDYGTAAAFIIAFLFMLYAAGIDYRYILVTFILIAIIVPIAYFYLLPEHAKTRIDVFLNPEIDPRGSGYNIIQSKLAIGAGKLTGMGVLKGNQTQLGYLYPKTTDFIFSVIGEEMGFIVSSLVVLLNVLIITKAVYIAKTAKDDVGSYIAIGIAGIFLFHAIENIGMTIGLLPITGVPLLFVSYGGSSMITSFMCIGILLSISGRRQKSLFVK